MAKDALLEDIDGEKGPIRQCALSRDRLPIAALIRFVLGPEGQVVADLRHRLPGRGLWLKADKASVREAVKRKLFTRAFKQPAQAPQTLPEDIEALMVADCLQSLAMANKAGVIICGFAKVEEALRRAALSACIEASDGGEDGRAKLARILEARFAGREAPAIIDLFDNAQLSLALGRENVIHAVALADAAGDAFVRRCQKLAGYRAATVPQGAERRPKASGVYPLNDMQDCAGPSENER